MSSGKGDGGISGEGDREWGGDVGRDGVRVGDGFVRDFVRDSGWERGGGNDGRDR